MNNLISQDDAVKLIDKMWDLQLALAKDDRLKAPSISTYIYIVVQHAQRPAPILFSELLYPYLAGDKKKLAKALHHLKKLNLIKYPLPFKLDSTCEVAI